MKATLLALAASFTLPAAAFALGGPITSPQLGHRAGIDAETVKKIHKAIRFMSDELEFVEGSFINQFSHYTLAGSMDKASSAIWLIREVGIWKVEVSVHPQGAGMKALTISQDSSSDEIKITVNSDHEEFDRELFENFLPKPDATLEFLSKALHSREKLADADAKGREFAKRDLRAGIKRIIYFGKPIGKGRADAQSGYPYHIAAGCVVSQAFVDVAAAYNKAMREAAEKEKR